MKIEHILFLGFKKVTYNLLQHFKNVVNDQYELKKHWILPKCSKHYPPKVVKIQLVLGARQDSSPGRRPRVRTLAGASGPVECLQPFDFLQPIYKNLQRHNDEQNRLSCTVAMFVPPPPMLKYIRSDLGPF